MLYGLSFLKLFEGHSGSWLLRVDNHNFGKTAHLNSQTEIIGIVFLNLEMVVTEDTASNRWKK